MQIWPFSAGIDFKRQNLILTSKVDPRTERENYL